MLESLIGASKEEIKAALKALGIKEGDVPQEPEHKGFSPREIIEVAVDGGKKRTQDDWIEYFNKNDQAMVSMPDLYNAGKSKDKKLLATLRKDFKESWEVTSTRLIYQPDSLDSRVVHYFGSKVIEPVEFNILISDYSDGALIKDVLDDTIGLAFLQAIFGTEDDKGVILETLKCLSRKGVDSLMVWTPNQEGRKEVPERRLLCGDYFSYFHVDCDYYIDDASCGCSSGVRR